MATRDMTTAEFRAALKRNGLKLENLFIAHYVSRVALQPHQSETKIPCLYRGKAIAKRATVSYAIKRFAEIAADEEAASRTKAS